MRFGGHSRAIYEDLCSFEVFIEQGGFRIRDELRNEFRGKVEGGSKGVGWRVEGKGYGRSGRLLTTVEQLPGERGATSHHN